MNKILKMLFGLVLVFAMSACQDTDKNGATSPENIIGVGPTADAGPDQTIISGNNIVFDGGNSNDPDAPNDELSYEWDLGSLGIKRGEVVEGTIPTSVPPGTYTIILTVTDREGNRATDTMDIIVKVAPPPPPVSPPPPPPPPPADNNTAPIANAVVSSQGFCDSVAINITLDGTDADGDTLSYSIVMQPVSGTLTVSGNIATYTNTTGCFREGTDLPLIEETFTYKVNDGKIDSNVATVNLSFNGGQ
jgi:hypothetical protein